GEGLEPCGDACDVCAGTATAPSRSARTGRSADGATRRTEATAGDALAVLEAVKTLPFPMGKAGLTKLVLGSVESRVRADRSPAFGALAGLPKGKVEGLIDRLIEDGYLHRDLDHEFKLISLTEKGAAATEEDIAGYDRRPRGGAAVPAVGDGEGDLDEVGAELLGRLEGWRRDRASRDAMPPYVVAHNSTLREVATARPRTAEELGRVKGFGPARVEKYGDEVLAIVGEA
ncbi:MAG: HRDC domain-containing protein, partial [Chloroflexota bacterium]|nr:HRDC domain-containing protein [Chloroflexota bacterium]